MTTPADADAPAPAQREAESGWGTRIAAGVVGFILVVEFVLPGFVAAEFSKTGHSIFLANGTVWGATFYTIKEPLVVRVEMWILTPADFLMMHSVPIRRFYRWQYRLAGGKVTYDPRLAPLLPPPDEIGK